MAGSHDCNVDLPPLSDRWYSGGGQISHYLCPKVVMMLLNSVPYQLKDGTIRKLHIDPCAPTYSTGTEATHGAVIIQK